MMKRAVIIDNRPAEREPLPEGLYVCQTIRTVGHRALHTARHLELLGAAAEELLGLTVAEDAALISKRITRMLADGGYPADMPSSVSLRKYISGETVIIGGDILPYRTLSMRTVHPRGVIVDYEVPFPAYVSSLSLAALEAARVQASMKLREERNAGRIAANDAAGVPVVLQRNAERAVVAADGAPLFILADDILITPPDQMPSVEFETVGKAAAKAGIPLVFGHVDEEILLRADEAFFFDCRGLTALSAVGRQPYMHIIAERIGRNLA